MGGFGKITEIGVIKMHVDITVLDAVLFSVYWTDIQVIREHLAQNKNATFTSDINIEPLLNLQYAYNPNPLRATFFPMANGYTIMFPNLQDGWATLFYNITRRLKAKSCYMTIMDYKKLVDASNYFIYCEYSQERVVYTLKEDRWMFYEQGVPLSFENTAYYTARQKKERLSKEIMMEYCESLGITSNGLIHLNPDGAFSYEYGKGQYKGAGATSFARK